MTSMPTACWPSRNGTRTICEDVDFGHGRAVCHDSLHFSARVREIRLGRIKATIWSNETQNGSRYNVHISRLYEDGTQWKDSTSFGRDDLLVVAKVADEACSWVCQQRHVIGFLRAIFLRR
jgi:hypothetical protein